MVTGRSADWCQPFLNHYHTGVGNHYPPWGIGMESARWEEEETLIVQVSVPCLPSAPRVGEALERGTRSQCPPPQAKSFWG